MLIILIILIFIFSFLSFLLHLQALSRYAYVLSETGQAQQALDQINRALALSPSNDELLVQVIECYVDVTLIESHALSLFLSTGALPLSFSSPFKLSSLISLPFSSFPSFLIPFLYFSLSLFPPV